MPQLDVERFLEDLSGRYARAYAARVQDMLIAMARGNKVALSDARRRLGEVIADTMGVGEVLGASIVLRDAAAVMFEPPAGMRAGATTGFRDGVRASGVLAFADTATQNILPRVTFLEAVEDMVERTPTTLRNAAERTAQNIARLYGEGSGGLPRVAFVRSAEQAVTERVQGFIAEAIKKGITETDFARTTVDKLRKMSADWSEAYARMAFRTNLNTAATAGRFRQGSDPDISAVLPCVQFNTAGDSDVRKSHKAGHKIILLRTNRTWLTHSPPLDYSCRCRVRDVGLPELRRKGRILGGKTVPELVAMGAAAAARFIREDEPPSGWFPNPKFRQGPRVDLVGVG